MSDSSSTPSSRHDKRCGICKSFLALSDPHIECPRCRLCTSVTPCELDQDWSNERWALYEAKKADSKARRAQRRRFRKDKEKYPDGVGIPEGSGVSPRQHLSKVVLGRGRGRSSSGVALPPGKRPRFSSASAASHRPIVGRRKSATSMSKDVTFSDNKGSGQLDVPMTSNFPGISVHVTPNPPSVNSFVEVGSEPNPRGISDNLVPGTLNQGTDGLFPLQRATNTPMVQGLDNAQSNPRDGFTIPSDRGISDNLIPGTLTQGTDGLYPIRDTNTPTVQGLDNAQSNPRDGLTIPSDRGISNNLIPGTLSQGTDGFYPFRATNTPMFQGSDNAQSNPRDGNTIPSVHSFTVPGSSASAVDPAPAVDPARRASLPRELPPRVIPETPASAGVGG